MQTETLLIISGAMSLLAAAPFALPAQTIISRSATVAAPAADVYKVLNSNRGFQTFNPYKDTEPDLKIEFFGPEEGAGSGFRFDGKEGKGTLEWNIEGVEPGDLSHEAMFLAELVVTLSPESAEAWGLSALLYFAESRRVARLSDGAFIPLHEQDTTTWNASLIAAGMSQLAHAKSLNRVGRFQLEAAIQGLHCERKKTGQTNWTAIAQLYDGLVQLYPTIGAAVAKAAAFGEAVGPKAGLQILDGIESAALKAYQPAWATRGHLHERAGELEDARKAYDRAIGLTTDVRLRRYLEQKRDAV